MYEQQCGGKVKNNQQLSIKQTYNRSHSLSLKKIIWYRFQHNIHEELKVNIVKIIWSLNEVMFKWDVVSEQ